MKSICEGHVKLRERQLYFYTQAYVAIATCIYSERICASRTKRLYQQAFENTLHAATVLFQAPDTLQRTLQINQST